MEYSKTRFADILVFVLIFILQMNCFAQSNLSKVYTFDQLSEASMFLSIAFDAKKEVCANKSLNTSQYLQSVKSVIDTKITEEFADDKFNIDKFAAFLQNAHDKCTCSCGIYTYIYEQLSVELTGHESRLENLYQDLEQKSKKLSSAEQAACIRTTDKWYCQSLLFKSNAKTQVKAQKKIPKNKRL
jgi:hypothetical protein